MIKKVELTNFYSFGKTTIELHPETNILIGINGSGKSNFLKALRLLKEGIAGIGLKKYIFDYLGGFGNMFHKVASLKESSFPKFITLEFTFDLSFLKNGLDEEVGVGDVIYTVVITESTSLQNFYVLEKISRSDGFEYTDFTSANIKNSSEDYFFSEDFDFSELGLRSLVIRNDNADTRVLNALKKSIRDIFIYEYFDTMPGGALRRPMLPTSENHLTPNGSNLTQLLNTIKINFKDSYRKIVELLREVNPNFEGFDFNFIGGNIELMLEERGFNSSIHVSNISDGTLRYLCLLAIICNPNRGKLICIDEPELGLHPDMILNLASAIKDAADTSTFVILTHSESLLNYFDIENLRVFEKDEQNGTIVKSFSTDQFSEWYEDYTIGQMWKQGDFGGVRYGN